jgi:hypothetical protein
MEVDVANRQRLLSAAIGGALPLLGPLTVNGGRSLSMLPALNSPVLDAGNPSGTQIEDQRGFPRVANAKVDMGASNANIRKTLSSVTALILPDANFVMQRGAS